MHIWNDFANSNPELAAYGAERLHGRVCYLATVRKSGAPRVHPVTPVIGSGGLWVFMEPSSPKGWDLRNDGRYALHCGVEDVSGGEGEFMVAGSGRLDDDPDVRRAVARDASYDPDDYYILFELLIESALATRYEDGVPRRERWQAEA